MSTPTAQPEVPPDVESPPLGHPVRSFVLVLVAVALALLAVEASGIVNPRVSSPGGGGLRSEDAATTEWNAVEVVNDALLPVEIVAVHLPVGSADPEAVVYVLPRGDVPGPPPSLPTPSDGLPLTLAGGEGRVIGVAGLTECPEESLDGDLRLTVRTAIGVERDVAVPLVGDPLPCA